MKNPKLYISEEKPYQKQVLNLKLAVIHLNIDSYRYLGVIFNEFLTFEKCAKTLSD